MELSVIIPTFNRPDSLAQALVSIAGQTFARDRFETIVVDNAPQDETASITESFKGKIANLRYVVELSPGLHNARHRGLREAVSDRLVFIDDDIEAFPGWLESVWHSFTNDNALMVGGKNLPKWECDPPEWLMRLWDPDGGGNRSLGYLSIIDFGDAVQVIDPSNIWGCNFSIVRSVLLDAGGFHPDAVPDDLLRLRGDGESHVSRYVSSRGLKAVYNPRAAVYHNVPESRMTLDYFRKRAFNQGISDSYSFIRSGWGSRRPTMGFKIFVRFLQQGLIGKIFRYIVPSSRYISLSLESSYWQGYRWHSRLFAEDEDVRHWVLRPDYLEP